MLERSQVGPGALRELKDLLYEAYLAAGAPTLDQITADIVTDDDLDGAPSRDTVRRCISSPEVPASQAHTVAVADVLARRAAWDANDLAMRVRDLWIQAHMTVPPGNPVTEVTDPFDLEVHRAIDTRPPPDGTPLPVLPAYVEREHDRRLAGVVAEAVAGASRIAVLVGGSSTGKTRACWEALTPLRRRGDPWRLWHPIDAPRPDAALAELADIAPYTVIWLNEAHSYLAPDHLGEQVAAGLRKLLRDPRRGPVLVLATLWPVHWRTLTTRTAPDRHAHARELLDGHKIKVPDAFTGADLAALAAAAGRDPRLGEATEHARDGQITQYLAGVPGLMDRYQEAGSVTKALIHAAMDARRLGAGPAIPLALLADAAPGYLTDTEWDETGDDWLVPALDYVTSPCKGISGILTRVKTGTPRNQRNRSTSTSPTAGPLTRAGQGPLYRLADYLDQHGRRHRADQIPPIDFWTAAAAHAHPADLTALGSSAWDRGLYRDAAQLHKHAAAHGSHRAATALVTHLHAVHPADQHAAQWAVTHARLDDPYTVADLLFALRSAGMEGQVAALLARDPVAHVSLDKPSAVAFLLVSLRMAQRAEAVPQIVALLARDPAAHISLDDPHAVVRLLDSLREAGAASQVVALLARDPLAHASLDNPRITVRLLDSLRAAGAEGQAAVLAERAVAHISLDDPNAVATLLDGLRRTGMEGQVAALLARGPVAHVSLDHPGSVARLLRGLREAGMETQVAALLARDPVAHVSLDHPHAVASLLVTLLRAGMEEQVAALLARDPAAHVSLGHRHSVDWLLRSLQVAGVDGQGARLPARDPAAHVSLDNGFLAWMLDSLGKGGADGQGAALPASDPLPPRVVSRLPGDLRRGQVALLAERLPAAGQFESFIGISEHRERFRFGREPYGSVAAPWVWGDLE